MFHYMNVLHQLSLVTVMWGFVSVGFQGVSESSDCATSVPLA